MEKLQSPFLGEIHIEEDKVITFPSGLIGFGDYRRFLLLEDEEGSPFWYLQSVEDAELFFVLINPVAFFQDYQVEVKPEELQAIDLDDPNKAVVLALVTVPEQDVKQATVNLKGPLVINPDRRLGKQVVLHPSSYSTRHPLFNEPGGEARGAV